jgi:hypothetical protein
MINNYQEIEAEKPFFILHKDPKKQDITVWKKRADGYGLLIFFHGENFWCNPPTDSSIEWRAGKAIEKYGIAYLTDADDYIEGYKNCAWNEGHKYRQDYADKFFGKLEVKA